MRMVSGAIKGLIKGCIYTIVWTLVLLLALGLGQCFGDACDAILDTRCVFGVCDMTINTLDTYFPNDEALIQAGIYLLIIGSAIGLCVGIAQGSSAEKAARLANQQAKNQAERDEQTKFSADMNERLQKADALNRFEGYLPSMQKSWEQMNHYEGALQQRLDAFRREVTALQDKGKS